MWLNAQTWVENLRQSRISHECGLYLLAAVRTLGLKVK